MTALPKKVLQAQMRAAVQRPAKAPKAGPIKLRVDKFPSTGFKATPELLKDLDPEQK